MKKILLFILCLFFGLALVGCNGAYEKAELSDFEYTEASISRVLLKKYIGTKENLMIKGTIEGFNVLIGNDCFKDNQTIKSVLIKNIYTIPASTFENCDNLESVKFKAVNEEIKDYAFANCDKLNSVKFSGSLVELSDTAFINCPKLSVLKGGSAAYIVDNEDSLMYHDTKGILYVGGSNAIIPDGVVEIRPYAFYGRTDLESIVIPATVKIIGENAFGNCPNLKQIKVDNFNEVYDSRENCNAIIEKINDRLIVGCTNTIIPKGVKAIASYAFSSCDGLTGITIPSTVKIIEKDAFYECKNIKTINVSPDNSNYDCRDNSNALIETETNKLILACDNSIIPSTVKAIATNAFSSTKLLDTIALPEGVEKIEDKAFYGLKNLKNLMIPSTVNEIGSQIVSDCDELQSITVSEYNFKYDSRDNSNAIIETETNKIVAGCKNTIIPASVKVIGKYAFEAIDTFTEIRLPDTLEVVEDYAYLNCANVNLLILSDSITTIGEGAFMGLSKVESITIPNSVTSIGTLAFANCDLWKIKVADDNPVYDSRENCDAIIETETNALIYACANSFIPDSVTSIKENAFYGSKIKKVEISANVTEIEVGAFKYAKQLLEITVDALNPIYDSRENCNAIIEKASNKLIAGCANTVIADSVTSIEAFAFAGNEVLDEIDMTKHVTTIGASAFESCPSLIGINLPKTITYVDENAFRNSLSVRYTFNIWGNKYTEEWHENWEGKNK